MVDELTELEQQAQQLANQDIPRRRFGSRITPQRQQQIIQQKQQAEQVLNQIQAERLRREDDARRQALEEDRAKKVKAAINSRDYTGLTPQETEFVKGRLKASSARADLVPSSGLKGTAVASAVGGGVLIKTPTGSIVKDIPKGNGIIERVTVRDAPTSSQPVAIQKLSQVTEIPVRTVRNVSPEFAATREEKLQLKISEAGNSKNQFVGAAAGAASSLLGKYRLLKNVVTQPITTAKNIATSTKEIGRKLLFTNEVVFPEVGEILRTKPGFSTGYVGFEFLSAKTVSENLPRVTNKASDLIRTAGLRELPKETVIAPEYFKGQRYPAIKRGQTAGQLQAEFYKIDPNFNDISGPAGFTGSPSSFARSTTAKGSPRSEFMGLYQAPKLSATFLRVSGEPDRLIGLNPFSNIRPTALRLNVKEVSLVPGLKANEAIPTKARIPSSTRFMQGNLGGKSFIPFIKTEKESIVPQGTSLQFIQKRYFFKFEGRRIPILEFKTLEGESTNLKGTIVDKKFVSKYYSSSGRAAINPLNIYGVSSYRSSRSYPSYSIPSSRSSISSSSLSKGSLSNSPSYVSSSVSTSFSGSSKSISVSGVSRSFSKSPRSIVKVPTKKVPLFTNKRFAIGPRTTLVSGYRTFVLQRGKKRFLPGVRSKGLALMIGEEIALKELRATFGVEKAAQQIRAGPASFAVNPSQFRGYKIRKGKAIPLVNTFIQRKGKRLSSASERREIQFARRRL